MEEQPLSSCVPSHPDLSISSEDFDAEDAIEKDCAWATNITSSAMGKSRKKHTKCINAQFNLTERATFTSLGKESPLKSGTTTSKQCSEENLENLEAHKKPDEPCTMCKSDSSSQLDADIDDDVFSCSERSKSSSWNSYMDHANSNTPIKGFSSTIDTGEKIAFGSANVASLTLDEKSIALVGRESLEFTKRKTVARSAFRNPSACAMHMSSPTISSFPSSFSVHRTPNSGSSPTRVTPSRLKPKKEDPLVLLHLTVMPLNYSYSFLMSSPDLPESLRNVQENWRLLLDKLGDTVLERGVLLAHPHDSYETLEERFLEALDLPTCPRVRILKCGHYIGPCGSGNSSSDEENEQVGLSPVSRYDQNSGRRWCDICRRDIRLQDLGESEGSERRFRIKIYASNGLMSPGAWAAAWREMERVDIEIEPYVEPQLLAELKRFALYSEHLNPKSIIENHEDDEYEDMDQDEELKSEDHFNCHNLEHEKGREELEIEAEIREHEEREEMRQKAVRENQEREEESRKFMEEQNIMKNTTAEEKINREIFENDSIQRPKADIRSSVEHQVNRTDNCGQESLTELLISAARVIFRERRNIILSILAILIVFLALVVKRSGTNPWINSDPVIPSAPINLIVNTSSKIPEVLTKTITHEITVTQMIPAASTTITSDKNLQIPLALPLLPSQVPKVDKKEYKYQEESIQIYSPPDLKKTYQETIGRSSN